MGNPARPRAAVPPLIKKPANSGRRYSARYWRRGSGKRSFWRAVRTRLTAISFSPAGKYTNRGKWGFTQAPPACSCGTRTPEAFFRQNKKQTSHINSFFRKAAGPLYGKVCGTAYTVPDTRSRRRGRGPRTKDSACIMPGPCQLDARMRHGNSAAKIKTSAFLFIIFIFYPELFPHREAPGHHLFYPSRRPEHAFKTNPGNLIMFIQVSTEVFF